MSSIALKFSSLVIRTLSKPIAVCLRSLHVCYERLIQMNQNFIKKQAREHEGFRRTCISFAQSLHRVDMRMRLGILQDTAAIDRAHAKEAAEAASKKQKAEIPTVKTEAQMKVDEKAAAKAKESAEPKAAPKPRIRPLSEAKAVDTGATFISEAFLFGVAASLILFESWRSRRKETSRREDVADRLAELEESEKAARRALVELEREVLQLRAKKATATTTSSTKRILPRDVWDVPEKDENEDDEKAKSWLSRIVTYISSRDSDKATNEPGPAEKILAQSEAALAEKHRKALEDAAKASNEKAKS
jgi:hypothetical protein